MSPPRLFNDKEIEFIKTHSYLTMNEMRLALKCNYYVLRSYITRNPHLPKPSKAVRPEFEVETVIDGPPFISKSKESFSLERSDLKRLEEYRKNLLKELLSLPPTKQSLRSEVFNEMQVIFRFIKTNQPI